MYDDNFEKVLQKKGESKVHIYYSNKRVNYKQNWRRGRKGKAFSLWLVEWLVDWVMCPSESEGWTKVYTICFFQTETVCFSLLTFSCSMIRLFCFVSKKRERGSEVVFLFLRKNIFPSDFNFITRKMEINGHVDGVEVVVVMEVGEWVVVIVMSEWWLFSQTMMSSSCHVSFCDICRKKEEMEEIWGKM